MKTIYKRRDTFTLLRRYFTIATNKFVYGEALATSDQVHLRCDGTLVDSMRVWHNVLAILYKWQD